MMKKLFFFILFLFNSNRSQNSILDVLMNSRMTQSRVSHVVGLLFFSLTINFIREKCKKYILAKNELTETDK
jgi:hypothetical protein